ncbi:MAG: lichenicidin A2 family type 2 lantibiotic [Lactobacillales bacterium]|jgi:type 2 lantibiotic (TIGR03893 family)|nr:lichenicidin A2 family type 2 lantibiotic [Lactobacillales bacterium]
MLSKEVDQLVGKAFEELSIEEMQELQGTGEVEVESTPACFVGSAIVSAAVSVVACRPTRVH